MQTLSRIEHFLVVARHGRFSAAARVGKVPQLAWTKSVRQLEASLGGIELLARRSTDVTLYDRGYLFHQRAFQSQST